MRKLLAASFSRLWKEKIFWLAFVFMSVGPVCFSWMSYNTAMKNTCFVFVFFISMRLGTEFDEHTIRNKLVVGYNRTQVYFAEYITCMAASLILLTDGNVAFFDFVGMSSFS